MSIANLRIMKFARAAVAFARQRATLERRPSFSKLDNRQLFALFALRRCFGSDNRWAASIPFRREHQTAFEAADWRALAKRLIEHS